MTELIATPSMKTHRIFRALVGLVAALAIQLAAADLPRSSPEQEGVSSAAIHEFIRAAENQGLHSFMMLRNGKVISEGWWTPYDSQSPHALFSLSKSFTSTAVGMAIHEGKFSLDDEVLKFFPDDAPAQPSRNLKSMRVRDLLRMNTGHQTEPPRPQGQSWKKSFLAHPVEFKPGTHFLYNTPATYMLSAIVEKTTGMSLVDYLQPRLFEPLGIQNPTWDKSPEGITLGGYGLSVRTEDIARFGQLYLQRGSWQGKQLIPELWVVEATTLQTSNGSSAKSDWDQGYCYQFWRCRNDAFRGDGAFGQYCIVMPKQNTVIAITSGLGNMQLVMDLVWDKILPGITNGTLPADKSSYATLTSALQHLGIEPQKGEPTGMETFTKTFKFPSGTNSLHSIRLENSPGSKQGWVIIAKTADGEQQIPCGYEEWRKGAASILAGTPPVKTAASGAWTSKDTFTAKVCLYETPFIQTWNFKFADDKLRFNSESNVSFGQAKDPELIGTLAD